MKSLFTKVMSLFLVFLMLLPVFASCKKEGAAPEEATEDVSEEVSEEVPEETSEPKTKNENAVAGSTTLMVFMVGSDLESKSGAGTNDLEEIAQSGVDAENVSVIVYATGSTKWHNDAAVSNKGCVLELKDGVFERVREMDMHPACVPSELGGFLEYCYTNYPAEHYGLIMWDHGNGPVIGYGKDICYNNDSMTLSEMEEGLAVSPFGDENRFDFVGFDACLMASAELACVWEPYADYLVASQEVEPSFGWDYSFLSELGKTDTAELLSTLADNYLASCLEYFEKKGYKGRDATLSVLDLSYAGELGKSLNALFAAAIPDVGDHYDSLAELRANTRSLGRASTGSEYDLVDLGNLVKQLSELYPDEVSAVSDALKKLVVANANNTVDCCGISIYYPFFNKSYYRSTWAEEYSSLDVFSSYCDYLRGYEASWLGADEIEDYATSVMPERSAGGEYTCRLTYEEQQKTVSAGYYILKRTGEDLYTRVYSSGDVTYKNRVITAGFDGNVIYVKNRNGNYWLPMIIEKDMIGDEIRYVTYVRLQKGRITHEDFTVVTAKINLSVDKNTKKISVTSVTAVDGDVNDTDAVRSGKTEEYDFADFDFLQIPIDSERFLARNEKGTVLGYYDWLKDGSTGWGEVNLHEDPEFVYAPLQDGEYYIMFHMIDTKNNEYCSEPLLCRAYEGAPESNAYEEVDLNWQTGDRLNLISNKTLKVDLVRYTDENGRVKYKTEFQNKTDDTIRAGLSLKLVNGEFCMSKGFSNEAEPGKKHLSSGAMDFSDLLRADLLKEVSSFSIVLTAEKIAGEEDVISPMLFNVTLSEKTGCTLGKEDIVPGGEMPRDVCMFNELTRPYYGITAKRQILYDKEGVKVTLLGLGLPKGEEDHWDEYLRVMLLIENNTDAPVCVQSDGVVANGVFMRLWYPDRNNIPAHGKKVGIYSGNIAMNRNDVSCLALAGIGKITSLTFQLRFPDPLENAFKRHGRIEWIPLKLETAGGASSAVPEWDKADDAKKLDGKKIFDKNGVKIYREYFYYSMGLDDKVSSRTWVLRIENGSEYDIQVDLTDSNNSCYVKNGQVGRGQTTYAEVYEDVSKRPKGEALPSSVSGVPEIYDFTKTKKLFTGDEKITLTVPD